MKSDKEKGILFTKDFHLGITRDNWKPEELHFRLFPERFPHDRELYVSEYGLENFLQQLKIALQEIIKKNPG